MHCVDTSSPKKDYMGWGGVGVITSFGATHCYPRRSSLALAHRHDATLSDLLLNFPRDQTSVDGNMDDKIYAEASHAADASSSLNDPQMCHHNWEIFAMLTTAIY